MALHENSAQAGGVYARKSTGLVREGGAWSVLIYNINFVSIGLMTLFAVLLIPAFYPGGNMQLAFLICLIVVLPTSMVFAMFSAAMPRSGGDYVYVSRVLGPSWGMMSNWNQTVWWILYGGVPSAFFAYFEDVDLSFRAQLAGHRVYYTQAAVAYHDQGSTSRTMSGFSTTQFFRNLPLLLVKNAKDADFDLG